MPATSSNTTETKFDQIWKSLENMNQLEKSKWAMKVGLLCCGLFLVIFIFHVATVTKSATSFKQTAVVFMDGDPMDYLALHYLLRRSDTYIPLIVLNGNGWSASLVALKQNLNDFLAAEYADIGRPRPMTEIVYGASFTTAAGVMNCTYLRAFDPKIRITNDLLWGANGLPPRRAQEVQDAQLFSSPFFNLLNAAAPNSISILTMGPLTDLATYLATHPAHVGKIKRVFVEAGVFAASNTGNVKYFYPQNNGISELNIFFDPVGAEYILERVNAQSPMTALPVTIFPLEASRRCDVGQSRRILDAATQTLRAGDTGTSSNWVRQLIDSFAEGRISGRSELERLEAETNWPVVGSIYPAIAFAQKIVLASNWQYGQLRVYNPVSTTDLTNVGRLDIGRDGAQTQISLRYDCESVQAHLQRLFSSPQ